MDENQNTRSLKHEFLERKIAIEEKFRKDINRISSEYAFSNKIADIGDIVVSNNKFSIIVDEIRYTTFLTQGWLPECIYIGRELTIKMVPKKRESLRRICQRDVAMVKKNKNKEV